MDKYKKAYEILCKRANGTLKLEYNGFHDTYNIIFKNKWISNYIFYWQNGQLIDIVSIKNNDCMTLFDEVCISKTLLQYANDYDVSIGLFDPQVLLHKGEILEFLLIESDLKAIA
jgi:cobalamin biosynthesis Co2+ chelatase CbiK